jgi:hypothetical protein
VNIIKDRIHCINIEVEKNDIALFAAEELQKYFKQITNCQVPIRERPAGDKPSIFIGSLEWCGLKAKADFMNGIEFEHDGYCIKKVNKDLVLTSKVERGFLFAVYSLLESLGCRWFFPGKKGEIIPSLADISINDDILSVVNPDYEIRNFMDASNKSPIQSWKEELHEVIDWCCKNKMNSILLHNHPYEQMEGLDAIKSDIKKRGLIFEYGGHGTQLIIERSLFEQKPYLFREKDGVRRNDGNFCGSNEETISILVKGVEEILETNSGIDILHLWFDDVYDGSWCACQMCSKMSAPDQVMNVMNQIFSGICKKYPTIKGDIVLYHDTLDSNNFTMEPHPNVFGYFAPRERCYAHSIGDPSCERNLELKAAVGKFSNQVYTIEYYTDMILFSKMQMFNPQVIANDLTQYKETGVNKMGTLAFLRYSWWAYAFNMYVFAKGTWNNDFDYAKGLNEFCEKLYPKDFKNMLTYYSLLEQASFGIFTFCGYNEPLGDIRNIPPQAPEFYKKHIGQIKESISKLEQCATLLDEILESSNDSEGNQLKHERQLLQITIKEAQATYYFMLGRYKLHQGEISDIEEFYEDMDKVITIKNELKSLIEIVPMDVKGCGGMDPFVAHLCDDQITFVNYLKEAASK